MSPGTEIGPSVTTVSSVTSETASATETRSAAASNESGVDAFPQEYARTRRFTIGVPRNHSIVEPKSNESTVLFLRSRDGTNPTMCLYSLDVASGTEKVVVDPKHLDGADDELPPAEQARRERLRESGAGITAYSTDRRGSRACLALAGSLFIIDLTTGEVTTPPVTKPVFDPRLSPDGRHIAYVSGNGLRLVGVDQNQPDPQPTTTTTPPTVLSTDRGLISGASALVSYGRADFIAAEEMQRSRGFWWSPDSDRLLVTRVDETPVQQWWISDPAHPDRRPNEIRYPVAGSANALVDLLMIDLSGVERRIDWDEDGRYEYLADVIWPSKRSPLVVRQNRDQTEISIAELDLQTCTLTERRSITDDTWVELIPGSPTPCREGLLTIEDLTENSGTPDRFHPGRRALLVDGRPLTGDDINVKSIVGLCDRWAMVSAWTEPSEIHLFLVDTKNERDTVRLTHDPGVHGAVLGPPTSGNDGADHRLVIVTTEQPSTNGREVGIRPLLLDTESPQFGAPHAVIADLSKQPPIEAMPSFRQLAADRLESAVFMPSDYDGTEPLPVLLDPYGGPHAQRVLKTHTRHLVSQWFADQGFVVLVTDGRGTPGRGPAWERQIWGDLATPILEDQLAALDDAADEYDFLDLDRVAIRGWSFGGYLAALAVLRHPDRFHAAIAGAPVTDWRLYDTHYTERYLGHPNDYPQHYGKTSLISEAANLSQPLLLIHGLADDNVVAAHTLQFSTALMAAAAPHQVLPLSGVTHMTPQEVVAENLLWLQLRFLREALHVDGASRQLPHNRHRPPARPPAVHPKTAPLDLNHD